MCEGMVGCQGVAFMTWLWIPVLEASRSSRLSVVGYKYTVYVTPSSHNGRCAKVCWHSWSWPISLFLMIANGFVPITYCFVVMDLDTHFVSPSLKPSGWAFLYFRAFMQAVTMTRGLLSNFLWFSCHRSESCGLTIFMLDEERQIIGPCRWFDLATQTPASERPGACCESSSGLLPTDWIQSLFLSLRKDGATVICSCIGRYYTIPYSSSAAKESARQSKTLQTLKWRCKKYSCIHSARGTRWCKQDIL